MGLDFYIANSNDMFIAKKMITAIEDFAGLNEELQEYIYKNRSALDFDVHCLIDIDPYADTMLEFDKIIQIMKACKNITESDFLQSYEDVDGAINTFLQLKSLCEKAVAGNKNIIAIGD